MPQVCSDHTMLQFDVVAKVEQPKTTRICYLYDKADFPKMGELLDLDWKRELEGMSPQQAMDHLEGKINSAVKECVPTKKMTI